MSVEMAAEIVWIEYRMRLIEKAIIFKHFTFFLL